MPSPLLFASREQFFNSWFSAKAGCSIKKQGHASNRKQCPNHRMNCKREQTGEQNGTSSQRRAHIKALERSRRHSVLHLKLHSLGMAYSTILRGALRTASGTSQLSRTNALRDHGGPAKITPLL